MDIPCTMNNKIKCTKCNTISLVSELRTGEGNKFPRADKDGASWESTYYYCLFCDDSYAKVFDPGDGNSLVLGANVELVELQ